MKIIILFLLISHSIFSQKVIYNKIEKTGDFTEYETKSKNILKIGDTITIGYPFSGNFFTFITQGGAQTSPILSNKKVVVSKIKSVGSKNSGYKIYPIFKGFGWVPIYIDYESALETGEIKNPFQTQ
jgi:hypothetical protein